MNRICIQWPRFGPYHLARLRAAHAHFAERGAEVIGFETAGDDALYEWRVEQDEEPFRREQVFPGRVFEDIAPAEMHAGVVAALDRLDPDAVGIMSYGYPDARAALAWCRRRRRVAVIMMETKADDAERVGWRERVKALIVAQFDAALVGGTPQRDYMEQLGFPADLIFTTYNAVDNAYFREGAEAARANPEAYRHLPGLDSDEPFFLASNRFLPRKNLDRLLLGYGRYRERAESAGHRPWRLLMLGDGRLRPELEGIVREEAIGGVEFCGFQQIDVLPAYYAFAGAFVHSASVDQWGLVVNEAMAAGLPVVVSTGTGCSYDLVRDGVNGFRFEPEDVEGLADRLARVAAPDADREAMGRRSEEIIEGWAPAAFGRGLWDAVQAGRDRADRPANPLAQALLTGINRASRDITAFHSVEV